MGSILNSIRRTGAWLRDLVGAYLAGVWVLIPIVLIALALASYGWWWRVVADGIRQNAATLQAQQTALGRELIWDAFNVEGFPYRVDTTVSSPRFTAPDRGTEWRGERVVVHVAPLAINRAVFSLEGLQHFFYGMEGQWIESEGRADKALLTLAAPSKGHQNFAVEIERLTGKATINSNDFNVIVDEASADLDLREPMPRVDVIVHLKNAAVQGKIDLPLGRTVSLFDVDAGLKFPTNLPQTSPAALFAAWRNAGTPVELRRFELDWGGVQVSASGTFLLDAQSLPEGRLLLKLGNHARILELLETYGWITKDTRALARPVLDLLSFASGDPQRRVTVPLRIEKGEVYLGPARIGTLRSPTADTPLAPTDMIP